MKKFSLLFLMAFAVLFATIGCACNQERRGFRSFSI